MTWREREVNDLRSTVRGADNANEFAFWGTYLCCGSKAVEATLEFGLRTSRIVATSFWKRAVRNLSFSPSKVTADSSREGENGLSKYDTQSQGTNNNEWRYLINYYYSKVFIMKVHIICTKQGIYTFVPSYVRTYVPLYLLRRYYLLFYFIRTNEGMIIFTYYAIVIYKLSASLLNDPRLFMTQKWRRGRLVRDEVLDDLVDAASMKKCTYIYIV